jgi:hypothetical protein
LGFRVEVVVVVWWRRERERGYGYKHADDALCLNQSTSSGIIFHFSSIETT